MSAVPVAAGVLSLPILYYLLAKWIGQVRLYRRCRTFAELEPGHREFEEVDFFAKDGVRLHGWWFSHPEAKGAMLICHGNAGNVSHRMWMAEDLKDVPLHLFIFDYRGYGKSKGIPSEKGTAQDVEAAWEVIHQKMEHVEDPPILLYGRSLGGAVALQLPPRCSVRGVILECTFTSILELAKAYYPVLLPELTLTNRYVSEDRIRSLALPVLMAHSPDDELVPYEMGERLFQAAPQAWRFCVLEGGHDDGGWQVAEEYARSVREFVEMTIPDDGPVMHSGD